MRATVQMWLGQKTTIAGLSVIAGAVSAFLSGQINQEKLISIVIASVVAIALKENPSTTTNTGDTTVIAAPSTVTVETGKQ